MVQRMCWEKEVYCDHCGRRGKTEEFEPEGHHLICRLRMACEERYQDYLEFSKRLGSEMRQRYIDTAYRSSNRSQVEQSNQV